MASAVIFLRVLGFLVATGGFCGSWDFVREVPYPVGTWRLQVLVQLPYTKGIHKLWPYLSTAICAQTRLLVVDPTKDNLNDATKITKQECIGDYFNIGDILDGIGGGGMTTSSKSIEQNITRAFLEAAKKELAVFTKAEEPTNPLGEASWVVVKFTHSAAKDVTIAFRGCAPKTVYDKGICTILNHAVGVAAGDSEDCYSCSGELCNSGFRIFSRTSVFVALVSAMAFKLLF